jgi:PAS domain S-box-containing protein
MERRLIVDAPQLRELEAAAQASPWPQWWLSEPERTCVLLNEAGQRWLGSDARLHDEASVLHAIHDRLTLPDQHLSQFMAGTWVPPLRRIWVFVRHQGSPLNPLEQTSQEGVWVELLGLRIDTPAGQRLLLQARPTSDGEALAHDAPPLHPKPHAAAPLPAGIGLCSTQPHHSRIQWLYADGVLSTCSSTSAAAPAASADALPPALSAWDALVLRGALTLPHPSRWTVPLPGATGAPHPWLMTVEPRPTAPHQPEHALLSAYALPDATAHVQAVEQVGASATAPIPFRCRTDGALTKLGEGWEALTGRPTADCLQHLLTAYCPQPFCDRGPLVLADMLEPDLAGAKAHWPMRHADGSLRWVEVCLWPDPDASHTPGAALCGTLTDITERYCAEHFRRIVETALEHTVNGVVITDATRAGNPIVHVNNGFTRITGYSAPEVLGRNCNFLQGNEKEQPGIAVLRDAIASRESATVVLRNFRKNGSLYWNQIEISPVREPLTGLVTHYFALQTDITLQKQAEEAAHLRTRDLERVFRANPLGMVTLDETEHVRLLSPAFVRLFGVPEDAIQGGDVNALLAAIANANGTDVKRLAWPTAGHPVQWSLAGQAPRLIEVSATPLSGHSGERVMIFRDVGSDQHQHQTRSEFLTKAAHELRTPMGSICGFTELLLMREYQHEEARPLLETVLAQAMRLSALLNDMLDLSRMDALGNQAFALRSVDLTSVMKRAATVAAIPGSGRTIEVQYAPADTRIHGNPAKLEQVLINLLSNALKYSPGGGQVSMIASPGKKPGWWQIAVCDQGLGLTPEHLSRLFTRFFRADPGGPISGTGLGLVIVKELTERMGGHVEVQSKLGVGTNFTIHLQQSDEAATPPGAPLISAS